MLMSNYTVFWTKRREEEKKEKKEKESTRDICWNTMGLTPILQQQCLKTTKIKTRELKRNTRDPRRTVSM